VNFWKSVPYLTDLRVRALPICGSENTAKAVIETAKEEN